MKTRWLPTFALAAALAPLALAGLPGCSASDGAGCTTGACAHDGAARGDAAPEAAPASDAAAVTHDVPPVAPSVVALQIDPASATLVVRNGAPATTALRARGVLRDGTLVPVANVAWSVDDDRIGTVGADGTFTAPGARGGAVRVHAAVSANGAALAADATLRVRVERVVLGASVPLDAEARFAAATGRGDTTRTPRVVYPLEGAVMPANVAAPEVQWSASPAGADLFRVRIERDDAVLTAYVSEAAPGYAAAFRADRDAWRAVAETAVGTPVVVRVDRLERDANALDAGAPVRVELARGAVFGAVYYWDVDAGRMQRIAAASAELQHFMPNPPVRPDGSGERCVACHTVSRDGRYLVASMGSRLPAGMGTHHAAVFDLTQDLSGASAPTAMLSSADFIYAAFSPDSSRLLVNYVDGRLGLLDPHTGRALPSTGLPGRAAGLPDWSPDGHTIAFSTNTNNADWAVRFTQGDLALATESAPGAFDNVRVIHRGAALAGAPEGGQTDSHAAFAPDGRVVAFQHGAGSESIAGASAIYVIATEGGAARRLERAIADGASTPAQATAYWPTFAPFVSREEGGRRRYWLAFFSRRAYGNHGGSGDPRGARMHLWVTAVDPDAPAGTDPSSVPYFLPGQDPDTDNLAAYWAPEACRAQGAECSSSAECCSGRCGAGGRCEPPPPAMCRQAGQTCGDTSDCCAGLECNVNVCDAPPPG